MARLPLTLARTNITIARTMPSGTRRVLVDEQNMLKYSNDFSQSPWSTTKGSFAFNQTANPITGIIDITAFVEDTTTGVHVVTQTPITHVTTGGLVCAIFWVKAINRTWIFLGPSNGSAGVFFNIGAGAVSTVIGNTSWGRIFDKGNGWYECVAICRKVQGENEMRLYSLINNVASASFLGNGLPAFYIFNANYGQFIGPRTFNPTGATAIDNGPARSFVL